MKLYFKPGACSMADHIVLEWIGAPYTAEKMDKDTMQSARYRAINPTGAVPAVELDDGHVLTQNAAIMNYLADKFPQAGLGGDGTAESRAEVNRWLAFVNADVHPAFHPMFGSTAYLEDAAVIARTKEHALTKLKGLYAMLDQQLDGREWLAGKRSIADAYLYVTLRWAKAVNVDLDGLGNLAAFVARMNADPAVRKVIATEGLA